MADYKRSVIKLFDYENEASGYNTHIGGIPYNTGFRDGPSSISLYNKPTSVLYYKIDSGK